MITKKIRRKSTRTALRPAQIRAAVAYIRGDRAINKVVSQGALNFLATTPWGQSAEMVALATQRTRSANPVSHFVFSWASCENPTPAQFAEAVRIFMFRAGVSDHLVIFGAHGDTDNAHLHILVNRVSPTTGKVVEINCGFDIELLHQVVAELEHAQGWRSEPNARYRVGAGGELILNEAVSTRKFRSNSPSADSEVRAGTESVERRVIAEVGPLVVSTSSWVEFHEALAKIGLRYQPTRTGAVIEAPDLSFKASSIHRAASFGQLEKRFGPFEAPGAELVVAPSSAFASPLRPKSPFLHSYSEVQAKAEASRAGQRDEMRDQQKGERQHLLGKQADDRTTMADLQPVGATFAARNAANHRLALLHAEDRAELTQKHAAERAVRVAAQPPILSYRAWLRKTKGLSVADAWAYQRAENSLEGPVLVAPKAALIAGYRSVWVGKDVHYARIGDRDTAFIDTGQRVMVLDIDTPATVRAALELARVKWSKLEIHGSDRFKRLAVAEAIRGGFASMILNPELQPLIAKARNEQAAIAAQAAPPRNEKPDAAETRGRARRGSASDSIELPKLEYEIGAKLNSGPSLIAEPDVTAAIYKMHFREVAAARPEVDLSRVDAEAALAMRLTGHGRDKVQQVIFRMADQMREPPEARDWQRYADKAVCYAFGPASDIDAARLQRHVARWSRQEAAMSNTFAPAADRPQSAGKAPKARGHHRLPLVHMPIQKTPARTSEAAVKDRAMKRSPTRKPGI